MWGDIVINILSDFLTLILGISIYWLFFLIVRRNELLKFFGISKNKKVSIYLSNVRVQKYGSKGLGGILYSYQGQSIPYEESKAAIQLKSLFNYFLPSLFEKPKLLSKLLISDIDANVIASPDEENIIDTSSSIISLGFPAYNSVSNNIENSYKLSAKSGYVQSQDTSETSSYEQLSQQKPNVIPSGTAAGTATPYVIEPTTASTIPHAEVVHLSTIISGSAGKADITTENKPIIAIEGVSPYDDTSVGFVQRVLDIKNKRSIFYVAGLSENSTAGSAYYLIGNWKSLYTKYGSETPFLVLLRIDDFNNRNFEIILEK